MPIYEYDCPKCRQPFEQLVLSADDERDVRCPQCGAAKVTRRPSTFAARGAPDRTPLPTGVGCGRCGDPNGPCALD